MAHFKSLIAKYALKNILSSNEGNVSACNNTFFLLYLEYRLYWNTSKCHNTWMCMYTHSVTHSVQMGKKRYEGVVLLLGHADLLTFSHSVHPVYAGHLTAARVKTTFYYQPIDSDL